MTPSVQRVADLYTSGLTLREICVHLGIEYRVAYRLFRESGVPARRVGRRREAEKVAAQVAIRGVQWRSILLDALNQTPVIGVLDVVARHLGRYPTRAEQSAARRAAARLGQGPIHRHHLKCNGPGGQVLVLSRPDVEISDIDPESISGRNLKSLGNQELNANATERLINQIRSDSRRLRTDARIESQDTAARLHEFVAAAIDDPLDFQDQLSDLADADAADFKRFAVN